MAGIHDRGAADDALAQGARRQRSSRCRTRLPILGIGNESWDCGGNMTRRLLSSSQMKRLQPLRPQLQSGPAGQKQMLKIAVGPGGAEPRWTDWTETIMKAYEQHTWSWDIEWPFAALLHGGAAGRRHYASVGFGENEYAQILKIHARDGRL